MTVRAARAAAAAGRPGARLEGLSRARLEEMAAAGAEVLECYRVLAKTGDNPVREVLRGGGRFVEWRHYPKGDVYDHETGAQFYYHAHPQFERGGEHGHFHLFLRPAGMPRACRPAPLPDYAAPKDPNDALSHIVAIAMDRRGAPAALFATNRWVTGETWYAAKDVTAMVRHFDVDLARPSWAANRWVTAMVRLFRPQIEDLARARDRAIAAHALRHPRRNIYEDRALEIAARLPIGVDAQIEAVRRALARRTAGTRRPRGPST